jgi:hypothetical protein
VETTRLLRRIVWAGVAITVLAVTTLVVTRTMASPALKVPLAAGPASRQAAAPAQPVSPLEWPTYLHAPLRTGYTTDSTISAANAATLSGRSGWPVSLGGTDISTQPVVVNGVVYSGSWDGDEYAVCASSCVSTTAGKPTTRGSGSILWKTPLGRTTPSDATCGGSIGVVSTASVATVTVHGDAQPSTVLYVGGGGNDAVGGGTAKLLALDATTGAIRWKTVLGTAPATLIFSSPLVYTPAGAAHPSVYVGVSSYGDCPLVRGRLVQIDATTGAVEHEFDTVPQTCLGGSVWGSPTVDPVDGSLYFATGNGLPCASSPEYNEALVRVRSTDMSLLGAWQVPDTESSADNDFGSVPTLFTGTVGRGAPRRPLVGIGSKNGVFYVFDRTHIGSGPLVRLRIATGGTCGECGQGIIAPAAYDGNTLYVAGGSPPGSTPDKGIIEAFNPNSLQSPLWTHGTDGMILDALTAAPGIIVAGEGNHILIVNARTGATVATLPPSTGIFYGAASISHGVLYEGDTSGLLFAYSIHGV